MKGRVRNGNEEGEQLLRRQSGRGNDEEWRLWEEGQKVRQGGRVEK